MLRTAMLRPTTTILCPRACKGQLLKPRRLEPVLSTGEATVAHLEKAQHSQRQYTGINFKRRERQGSVGQGWGVGVGGWGVGRGGWGKPERGCEEVETDISTGNHEQAEQL